MLREWRSIELKAKDQQYPVLPEKRLKLRSNSLSKYGYKMYKKSLKFYRDHVFPWLSLNFEHEPFDEIIALKHEWFLVQ